MSKNSIRIPEDLPTSIESNHGRFTVYDWMAAGLGLSLLPLLVFALIFSVTIGGDGSWHGSNGTMAKRLGVTKRALIPVLRDLTERGLIEKHEAPLGCTHTYKVAQVVIDWYYSVVKNGPTPCEDTSLGGVKLLPGPSENPSYNKVGIEEKQTKADKEVVLAGTSIPAHSAESTDAQKLMTGTAGKEKKNCAKRKEKRTVDEVDLRQRIINTYPEVGAELAGQFASMRDEKGAPKSESAWRDLVFAIEKAKKMGHAPAEFLHFIIYHGWQACNAQYVYERLAIAQPEELREMTIDEAVRAFVAPSPSKDGKGCPAKANTKTQKTSVNERWHRRSTSTES